MKDQGAEARACINYRAGALFFILILIIYSNTFHASWHFDDFHNITQRSQLHIENLYPDTLYHAVFGKLDNNKVFYRPVACLSFALNWYSGKTNVIGYHFVNISVHILTTFFLYLAILALFKSPNIISKYKGGEYFIAFLAATLWAVNPIQTQAVTYIVQRMASMAAMFYILALYLYLKARVSASLKNKIFLFLGVFGTFLLAVGSKENALMLPVSIVLLEIVFFQDFSDPKIRKRFYWIVGGLALALFVVGVLLFMTNGFVARLQEGYADRPFTLKERLLTEPRVVLFYFSQIFYPVAERFSIVHDIKISRGFFQPWTTLPAILLTLGIIVTAFLQIKKFPLFSFAVLFFFLNHVIESTIIPLELVFEHRNYLPSLFLFLPIAVALKKSLFHYYSKKKRVMTGSIICFVTLLIMALGIGTYARNMVWADEQTLWQDALEKAPGSARPYHNLSACYYAKVGNYKKVIELCEKAIGLREDIQQKARRLSLENIAYAYAKRDKDYAKVIEIYEEILNISPNRNKAKYHLVLALAKIGRHEEALAKISQLLQRHPGKLKYLNTRALIYLQENKPRKALEDLKKAIKIAPDNEKSNISIGLAKSMLAKYERAEHYWNRIPDRSPQKAIVFLLVIENNIKAGNNRDAKKYASKLIGRFNLNLINKELEEASKIGLEWPISKNLVAPVIAKELGQQSNKMANLIEADES